MKRKTGRKLTDSYVDKEIQKIYDLKLKCDERIYELPSRLYEDGHIFLLRDVKKVLKHRNDLSFVKGFFSGYALASSVREE